MDFDDSKLDFENASVPVTNQAMGSLLWNFSDLVPFETRTIGDISFTVLDEPINHLGDTLSLTANINSTIVSDETPENNTFTFKTPITFDVLPVTIEYFKGSNQGFRNYLTWKAVCIATNEAFNIERSTDNIVFKSLSNITSGSSRCQQPFDYTDESPINGINYYRIRMTDMNDKTSYSNIIALQNIKSNFEIISLSPNPVTGNGILNIHSTHPQQITIRIIDATGQSISLISKQVTAGSSQVVLKLGNLASGLYTLIINTSEGEKKTMRFIKQ